MKTPSSTRTAYRQLLDRIRNIPGVQAADITTSVPLNYQQDTMPFWIDSHKPAEVQAAPRTLPFITGPEYLRTMEIPLLQGRFFTPQDTTHSPCVVAIDSAFARTYFAGKDPLGHTITVGFQQSFGPCRIIGVVRHVRDWGLGNTAALPHSESYFALFQAPNRWVPLMFPSATIIARTHLDPATMMPEIKEAVYASAKNQAVYNVQTMGDIVSNSMSSQRLPLVLLGAFAGLALLLASVGIYGVISYTVTQRTHEIGIRMALGAERLDVLRMVVGQGLWLALIGVAIGIAGAMALTRFLSSLLYGVKPTDPLTFIAVSLILMAVALLACYIPARHAAKVDPMVALRYE
jgi:putative ABC transport system permease protein